MFKPYISRDDYFKQKLPYKKTKALQWRGNNVIPIALAVQDLLGLDLQEVTVRQGALTFTYNNKRIVVPQQWWLVVDCGDKVCLRHPFNFNAEFFEIVEVG